MTRTAFLDIETLLPQDERDARAGRSGADGGAGVGSGGSGSDDEGGGAGTGLIPGAPQTLRERLTKLNEDFARIVDIEVRYQQSIPRLSAGDDGAEGAGDDGDGAGAGAGAGDEVRFASEDMMAAAIAKARWAEERAREREQEQEGEEERAASRFRGPVIAAPPESEPEPEEALFADVFSVDWRGPGSVSHEVITPEHLRLALYPHAVQNLWENVCLILNSQEFDSCPQPLREALEQRERVLAVCLRIFFDSMNALERVIYQVPATMNSEEERRVWEAFQTAKEHYNEQRQAYEAHISARRGGAGGAVPAAADAENIRLYKSYSQAMRAFEAARLALSNYLAGSAEARSVRTLLTSSTEDLSASATFVAHPDSWDITAIRQSYRGVGDDASKVNKANQLIRRFNAAVAIEEDEWKKLKREHECDSRVYDLNNPEQKEHFNQWLEEQRESTRDVILRAVGNQLCIIVKGTAKVVYVTAMASNELFGALDDLLRYVGIVANHGFSMLHFPNVGNFIEFVTNTLRTGVRTAQAVSAEVAAAAQAASAAVERAQERLRTQGERKTEITGLMKFYDRAVKAMWEYVCHGNADAFDQMQEIMLNLFTIGTLNGAQRYISYILDQDSSQPGCFDFFRGRSLAQCLRKHVELPLSTIPLRQAEVDGLHEGTCALPANLVALNAQLAGAGAIGNEVWDQALEKRFLAWRHRYMVRTALYFGFYGRVRGKSVLDRTPSNYRLKQLQLFKTKMGFLESENAEIEAGVSTLEAVIANPEAAVRQTSAAIVWLKKDLDLQEALTNGTKKKRALPEGHKKTDSYWFKKENRNSRLEQALAPLIADWRHTAVDDADSGNEADDESEGDGERTALLVRQRQRQRQRR